MTTSRRIGIDRAHRSVSAHRSASDCRFLSIFLPPITPPKQFPPYDAALGGGPVMKNRLHLIALVLFVLCFLYDLVVWGSVSALPDVGPSIADSARREAPLAATYITLGETLDSAVPSLQAFGAGRLSGALSEGFERIRADPTVAMDLIFDTTWNASHRWIKTMYWGAPVLLLLTIILWVRRPKTVHMIRRR
jgi:hypothetical protein